MIAPGPWAARFWAMLGMPDTIDIATPSGDVVRDRPMWTYWNLQEGEITVDPLMFATADGGAPPVIHLDTDAPLYTDDGELVTDELWGIYFKRDRHGVQGGASPLTVDGDVELDPYPSTTDVDPTFPDMWCAALSHSMSRFEGCRAQYKMARSGGVGAFTADNFPVFDYVRPNVYGIFDSNHGYKMIGVGREVRGLWWPQALLGDHSRLLYPFRFERFATGDLHPVSSSPVSLVLVALVEAEPTSEPGLGRRLHRERDNDGDGDRRHDELGVGNVAATMRPASAAATTPVSRVHERNTISWRVHWPRRSRPGRRAP